MIATATEGRAWTPERVSCPSCGAQPGLPCRTSTGTPRALHAQRKRDPMPERGHGGLQECVEALLQYNGWLCYHTRDSRGSREGFPDIAAAHRGRQRLLFAELKAEGADPTPHQSHWLATLAATERAEVYLWRPLHWRLGRIEDVACSEREPAEAGNGRLFR